MSVNNESKPSATPPPPPPPIANVLRKTFSIFIIQLLLMIFKDNLSDVTNLLMTINNY